MNWLVKAGAGAFIAAVIWAFLYALWDRAAFDLFFENFTQAIWRAMAFGGVIALLAVILHAIYLYATDLRRRIETTGHVGWGLLGETLIQVGLPKIELGIGALVVAVLGFVGTNFHVHP